MMRTSVSRSINQLRRLQFLPAHGQHSVFSVRAISSPSVSNRHDDHSKYLFPRHPRFLDPTYPTEEEIYDILKDKLAYPVDWPERYENAPTNWGIHRVPYDKAYIVERFGEYEKTLMHGTHVLIPFVHRIAFVHSLQNQSVPLSPLTAFTRDHGRVTFDAVLHYRIVDPKLASYGNKNPLNYMVVNAIDMMRMEIFDISLDEVDDYHIDICMKIANLINEECQDKGVQCLRIETKKIDKYRDMKKTLWKAHLMHRALSECEDIEFVPEMRDFQILAKAIRSPEYAGKPIAREFDKFAEALKGMMKIAIKFLEKKHGISLSSVVSKEKVEGA